MERRHRDLLNVLAYFYLRHERPDRAAVLYRLLDLLAPDDAPTMKGLAVALLHGGQPGEALVVLDRLEARGDGGASAHLLRGQALAESGRPAEANAAIARFLAARNPG